MGRLYIEIATRAGIRVYLPHPKAPAYVVPFKGLGFWLARASSKV